MTTRIINNTNYNLFVGNEAYNYQKDYLAVIESLLQQYFCSKYEVSEGTLLSDKKIYEETMGSCRRLIQNYTSEDVRQLENYYDGDELILIVQQYRDLSVEVEACWRKNAHNTLQNK